MKPDKYELFYLVVTYGLVCGLDTPKEWIRNYENSLTQLYPYEEIPEIEKLLWGFVVPQLYSSYSMREETDLLKLKEWVYAD